MVLHHSCKAMSALLGYWLSQWSTRHLYPFPWLQCHLLVTTRDTTHSWCQTLVHSNLSLNIHSCDTGCHNGLPGTCILFHGFNAIYLSQTRSHTLDQSHLVLDTLCRTLSTLLTPVVVQSTSLHVLLLAFAYWLLTVEPIG